MIDVICDDITKFKGDAIVNAADPILSGGGGVDGAIHRAAGPQLAQACQKLHGCLPGEAKLTPGYRLPARYVIHTVGPIYTGSLQDESVLTACYENALSLAAQRHLKTVAFPAISTGVYGYPEKKAAQIAVKTVIKWLKDHPDTEITVTLCAFDAQTAADYRTFLKKFGYQK